MITFIQAIILALFQGVSELFPVSSLGHSVIIPAILKWNLSQDSTTYLAFLVMLHLGTCAALFTFYYKEWIQIIKALYKSITSKKMAGTYEEHLGWLLVIGTIPVGIAGVLLEKRVKDLFSSPLVAAAFLVINGFILLLAETMKRKNVAKELKSIQDMSFMQAFIVGVCQAFALIPGISRSGASMAGGLVEGLNHEDSAKFSFMLATPAILAASLFEVRNVLHAPGILKLALLGAIVAGVSAYISTRFLVRYFKSGNLMPFVYYCWIIGLLSLFVLKFIY